MERRYTVETGADKEEDKERREVRRLGRSKV